MSAGCDPGFRREGDGPVCITCGDIALVMRVVGVGDDGLARCQGEDGASCDVEVGLLERVRVGDEVLVHAGVAIA
jgi:hydrogenase maturation factor